MSSSPVCFANEAYFLAGAPSPPSPPSGTVQSTSRSPTHAFSKPPTESITLVPGLGVEDDCHLGATVQHLSRMRIRPAPENLRQVHVISAEFLGGLRREVEGGGEDGGGVKPGDLGENITTVGIELEGLGRGAVLRFAEVGGVGGGGGGARVRIMGLRNPCLQIEKFGKGLLAQCVVKEGGKVVQRKAGVMGVVLEGGVVRSGMGVWVEEVGEGRLEVV